MTQMFANRREAGRLLARSLEGIKLVDPVILALPRGGVPVGLEVARRLQAPMDVLFVRKIGAPGHEEYGIGALADGSAPQVVIDPELAKIAGASDEYVQQVVSREMEEVGRRRSLYRTGPPVDLSGRSVIIVDDGIATGGTVRAALKALSKSGALKVIVAVPLAPREVLPGIRSLCDQLICLESPSPFYAVGAHYMDFRQTTDDEVIEALSAARGPAR